METITTERKLGEVVMMPRTTKRAHNSGSRQYEYLTTSKYVCIREAKSDQKGILVKFLGKVVEDDLMIVNGEPFCKDEKDEALESDTYYCFRFPTSLEMKEALDIIRADSTLHQTLEKAGMPINTEGTFWVRETIHSGVLRKRKLQYFDPKTNAVIRSTDPLYPHRRMSIVYF